MIMIIYKTTNLITNKIYVGLDTKNNPNYLGSGTIIKLSIKKYGKENFKKEILFESTTETIEQMVEMEVFWINKLNSFVPGIGYNIINTVMYNRYGKLNSEESNKKRSEKLKGKNNPMFGKKQSEESNKKRSEKMKGEKSPRFGTHHTEEVKKLLSEYRKGVPLSAKGIQNMRANDGKNNPMFGRHHSEETKNKISKKNKGKIAPNKGKKLSIETKQKLSITKINRVWICNELTQQSKHINKEELSLFLDNGWKLGILQSRISKGVESRKNRIRICNIELQKVKNVDKNLLESYLKDGWILGGLKKSYINGL